MSDKKIRIKREFVVLGVDTPVLEAAKICKYANVKYIIVSEDGKLVGVVTPIDFVYKIVAEGKDPKTITLGSIMSSPVAVCKSTDDVTTIAKIMYENGFSVLPVVSEEGTIEGVVSIVDVLYALGEAHLSEEMKELAKKLVSSTLHGVKLVKD